MTDLFSIPAAFAPAPVPKTIEWEQGGQTHQATIHIRPLSWQAVYNSMGEEENISHSEIIARRLADSLCDESGKALYSVADLKGETGKPLLCIELINALLNAIGEVNNAGKP